MNYIAKTLTFGGIQKKLVTLVGGCILFFLVLYSLLIGLTIQNIVERGAFEQKAAVLVSRVNEAELAYITTQSEITLESAHARGFRDSTDVRFVHNDAGALSFKGL